MSLTHICLRVTSDQSHMKSEYKVIFIYIYTLEIHCCLCWDYLLFVTWFFTIADIFAKVQWCFRTLKTLNLSYAVLLWITMKLIHWYILLYIGIYIFLYLLLTSPLILPWTTSILDHPIKNSNHRHVLTWN